MSEQSPLLVALKDPDFGTNEANHIQRILDGWKNAKGEYKTHPRNKIYNNVIQDLDAWREWQGVEDADAEAVAPVLRAIIHNAGFPEVQRWWLLKYAVVEESNRLGDSSEMNDNFMLAEIICSKSVDLAFWSRLSKSSQQCAFHEQLHDESPFMAAVSKPRTARFASHMLERIKPEPPAKFREFIWEREPTSRPQRAAMRRSDTTLLDLLLPYDNGEAILDDLKYYLTTESLYDQTHRTARLAIVQTALRYYPDLPEKKDALLYAIICADLDPCEDDKKVIACLFDKASFTSGNGSTAQELIRINKKELWGLDVFMESWADCPSRWCLLHHAVREGCEELVAYFSQCTNWVKDTEPGPPPRYALWYLSEEAAMENLRSSPRGRSASSVAQHSAPGTHHGSRDISADAASGRPESAPPEDVAVHSPKDNHTPSRKQMQRSIIGRLIQICTPVEIQQIVSDSKVTIDEISLDLSGFDANTYSFTEFVESLTNTFPNLDLPVEPLAGQSFPGQIFNFEATLKYVDIPNLPSQIDDLNRKFNDVNSLLAWLKEKRVDRIIELEVLDRLWGCHDEDEISKWLHEFKVEKVNWRCLDLSLNGFTEETLDRIVSIRLYSSGKRAVESHWFGPEGLCKLPRVQTVQITVVEDLLEAHKVEKILERLREAKNRHNASLRGHRGAIDFRIGKMRVQKQMQAEKVEGLAHIGERAIPQLKEFLQSYRIIHPPLLRRTKVAILDNGVMLPTISSDPVRQGGFRARSTTAEPSSDVLSHIVAGKSFVYGDLGRQSSWAVPTHPHGTQMANLICATDPHCRLYVAKVGEHHTDVDPYAVEKAIRWAIQQEVDIISMSFSFYLKSTELENALDDAHKANIVLIASAHDEGKPQSPAWPADHTPTIAIAASEKWGTMTPYTPADSAYNYRINGVEIFAGAVPFMASSRDRVSGSSAATAIAAGLASLILSCHHLSGKTWTRSSHWKRELVDVYLKHMSQRTHPKFVDLEQFCDLKVRKRERFGESGMVDAMKVIKDWFVKSSGQVELLRAP